MKRTPELFAPSDALVVLAVGERALVTSEAHAGAIVTVSGAFGSDYLVELPAREGEPAREVVLAPERLLACDAKGRVCERSLRAHRARFRTAIQAAREEQARFERIVDAAHLATLPTLF